MPHAKPRKPPDPLFAAVDVPHFPAQALSAWNPALRGRPFAIVEQEAALYKTPLLALSLAAQTLGVVAGYPAFLAKRKWPELALRARDLSGEARLRAAMESLFLNHTPAFSLRENGGALLDMTGTPSARALAPEAWARGLRSGLRGLGLEAASIGVAGSQVAARVLARLGRPDGTQICPASRETELLDPLSPELLPGLSPRCRELLRKYGIDTIAKLRRLGREELVLRFGGEGEKLYSLARGLDLEAFGSVPPPKKSLAAATVLSRDLNDEEALRNQVRLTADMLGHLLRLRGRKAGRVTLALTYADGRGARKTVRTHPPTASFPALAETAGVLFAELYQRRVALRRIELRVAAPVADTGQIDLFEVPESVRRAGLERAIDAIRRKRSFGVILSGSAVADRPSG